MYKGSDSIMNNDYNEDTEMFKELFELLNNISDKKQNDISHEETNDDDSDMELKNLLEEILGSIEITPEFAEKSKTVSVLEKKYTETFGDIISYDEEYNDMSLDEKIHTIQECLAKNKPKNIIWGGYTPSDEEKTQSKILKHFKAFY